MHILFLCSGNICRSPMAAVLFRRMVADREGAFEIRSAGTLGIEGHAASEEAREVMNEIGIDLTAHRSRGLTREAIDWADLIVLMEPRHEARVLTLDRKAGSKVVRLWEYLSRGDAACIEDPIGCSLSFYRECRRDLEFSLESLLSEIDEDEA